MKIERKTLVEIRFELAKSSNDDAQRLLDELDSILFDELCEVVGAVVNADEAALGETLDRAVEDMSTKELVESGPAIQHKSDCAVNDEPAWPASECDCQDCNLPELGGIEEEDKPIDRTKPVPGGCRRQNP